jgi:DNA-directed RNA polymerase specialized sigma24 family protein
VKTATTRLRLWSNSSGFTSRAERLGPWLFTVARNLHVSYQRSRVLEDSAVASLMALWPMNPAGSSPFEAAAAGELERRIERALAALPTVSRSAAAR